MTSRVMRDYSLKKGEPSGSPYFFGDRPWSYMCVVYALTFRVYPVRHMKIAMIIVRTLLGLIFVFASISFFLMYYFKMFPMPEMQGTVKSFNEGLGSVGYFFPLLKVVELLCGLAFLVGRYVPLALIVIAPVVINIFAFHSFIDRTGLPVAIFLVVAEIFLAYYYRAAFQPLLRAK